MQTKVAAGTIVFAVCFVGFALVIQVLLDDAGVDAPIPGMVGAHLIATPLALLVGRRAGRLSHGSVVVASVIVTVAACAAVVLLLDAVAAPAGFRVGWGHLFEPMQAGRTIFIVATALLVPQIWLGLIGRIAPGAVTRRSSLEGAA
ncbi:hypothetical protein [Dyella sp.]|jgi:hypothetical protein|uniref:hypothetical protein n=1 Tax=Dyella sp. TaxID=1869338 RepID=UPI002D7797C2|nr:hypothetical protein [Dyella sp.]HET6431569.1 hypothetical protein [Dyella sp.]